MHVVKEFFGVTKVLKVMYIGVDESKIKIVQSCFPTVTISLLNHIRHLTCADCNVIICNIVMLSWDFSSAFG